MRQFTLSIFCVKWHQSPKHNVAKEEPPMPSSRSHDGGIAMWNLAVAMPFYVTMGSTGSFLQSKWKPKYLGDGEYFFIKC